MAPPDPRPPTEELQRLKGLLEAGTASPQEMERIKQIVRRDPAMLGLRLLKMPPLHRFYRFTATALGASMWFWLMYRFKKDGPVLLGWRHPWEH